MPQANKLILVINCGSSSLKFGLFEYQLVSEVPAKGELTLLSEGLADSLGSPQAQLSVKVLADDSKEKFDCSDHGSAIDKILGALNSRFDLESRLIGVGHRIVHGGEHFKASIKIDKHVREQIEQCIPLAPLHNPANLQGIDLLQESFPYTPQIAVFDTAFHQTMPEHAFMYALPKRLYRELGIRRYGFHGSSHRYVSRRACRHLELPEGTGNFISAHLGNGASVTSIRDGKSVDTSMGLTPLEGLMMGTRSGDIDPGIFEFLCQKDYEPSEINKILNKESGLKGVSTLSNDMRTLISSAEQGNELSQLAIDMFCYRLAKYIAAMMVPLGSLDALIFTGGIGENSDLVRAQTVEQLKLLGFDLDLDANTDARQHEVASIHQENTHKILVIKTDEEKMIAEDTLQIILNN